MIKNQYFQAKDLNPLMGSLEKPIKELMELNIKTLQGMSYLTPMELMKVKKPEEILEKNVDVMIENGHKALDYMQNMFSLLEKNWLHLSDSIGKNTKEMMDKTEHMARTNINQATHTGHQAVKQASEQSKEAVKKAKSATEEVIHKTSAATKSAAAKAKPKVDSSLAKNREAAKNEMKKTSADRLQ